MGLSPHALSTLEAVKDYLKISAADTEYDKVLERQVNAVSDLIENYCRRHFEKSLYTEKLSGNGKYELRLEQYPVSAISVITVNGTALLDAEIDFCPDNGAIYREALWLEGRRNIEVAYEAGYVLPKDDCAASPRDLPYDLEDACIELVAAKFNLRQEDAAGKKTRQVNDVGSTNYEKDIPDYIRAVLDRYKKVLL